MRLVTQFPSLRPAAAGAGPKPAPPPAGGPAGPWTLRRVFGAYRGRILVTYALFNLENVLRLAQPLVLGLAINDLVRGSSVGLALFVAQHVAHLLVGSARRAYDTRAFTGIYTDLATRLVVEQRGRAVDVSRVAARSALSRAFVDFFERDVPLLVQAGYAVAGALVMLALFDWVLAPLCLGLLVPAGLLNAAYGRKARAWSGRLHDELEREVAVIGAGGADEVRAHYRRAAGWRVKLSDGEALTFGLTEWFVLGVVAVALARSCATHAGAPGDIFAIFRYVMMFVMGLDRLPVLAQQVGRLRDIGGRLRLPGPGEEIDAPPAAAPCPGRPVTPPPARPPVPASGPTAPG